MVSPLILKIQHWIDLMLDVDVGLCSELGREDHTVDVAAAASLMKGLGTAHEEDAQGTDYHSCAESILSLQEDDWVAILAYF
jgi:hypothetical protein